MLVPRRQKSVFSQSPKQKLIFLHIPKCGGGFIQDMFAPYSKRSPILKWKEAAGHQTYNEYEQVFKERSDDIQNYLIMTVVRNPWSWHVSWYNYIRNDRNGKRSGLKTEHEQFKNMSFDEYLDWLDDDSVPQSPQGYVKKQLSDWICNDEGIVMVDIVLRQESLFEDVTRLVNKLDLAIEPIQKSVNVSTKDDYRSYYSPEGAERIARRHQRDIELFQYSFASRTGC